MRALLEHHLSSPRGSGLLAGSPHSGAAGGAACGDLVRIAVRVEEGRVAEAGFDASGCAAARAAGSAVVELTEGAPVLDAARLTPAVVSEELGGLSPPARHAADLAADAFHRALGAAARDGDARLAPSGERTLVAMSGGVDSAVAALAAIEAGHETVAVTLELWSDPATDGEKSCCSPQAVTGARALAHRLGLPHFTLDLRDAFRAEVVDDFLAEYARGRTPNPCVRCNGLVRFDAMLALADALGAARLATGHYARIERDGPDALLRAAADPQKDQAYMLSRLGSRELARLWFPLGELEKPEVRARARAAGLPVADKRESQDLCFLAGRRRQDFMRAHGAPPKPGRVVALDGAVLGDHDGQERFTVGQRRGIGVSSPEPLYVVGKDAATGDVRVGPRSALRADRVRIHGARLARDGGSVDRVKLRYHARPVPCRVVGTPPAGEHDELELELGESVLGIAPGQIACLFGQDRVMGWGTIGEGTPVG